MAPCFTEWQFPGAFKKNEIGRSVWRQKRAGSGRGLGKVARTFRQGRRSQCPCLYARFRLWLPPAPLASPSVLWVAFVVLVLSVKRHPFPLVAPRPRYVHLWPVSRPSHSYDRKVSQPHNPSSKPKNRALALSPTGERRGERGVRHQRSGSPLLAATGGPVLSQLAQHGRMLILSVAKLYSNRQHYNLDRFP